MKRKGGLDLRVLRVQVVLIVFAGGVLLAGCGSSGSSTTSKAEHPGKADQQQFQSSGTLTPAAAAPPLKLRNYLGRQVNLDSYRGKAVLVTFIYTHCPDICPIIASNLGVAERLLGSKASKVQVIAVSVDPKGDTPKAIARFLARRQLTGRMQYLVGSAHELAAVWRAWGVGSERDTQKPEFVNHSGLVFGITASGKRLTIYASNFKPSAIAHDVPLLAAR